MNLGRQSDATQAQTRRGHRPLARTAGSTAAPAAADSVEVIHLTARSVQQAPLDLGAPGDSLGDQFVFSDDLFRRGAKVGIAGVVCTLVRLEPRVSVTQQCSGTAELPGGQITIQGLATFSEATAGEPFELAITGGTGSYRTAHGVMVVREVSPTEARLTLRIIH